MTTLQSQSKLRNIPLNEITEGDNVRTSYANIEELAASIERHGQLQPIGVYRDENEAWRILYGHRRLRAFQLLVDQGKAEFASVSAVIVERPSSLEVVQLIENIHRDDLSDPDKEKAVRAMVDRGMTQRDVARVLNKSETWVSRCLSALETRESVAGNPGAANLSTAAMAEISTLPPEQQTAVLGQLSERGSATVKETREAVKREKAAISSPTVERANSKWSEEKLAGQVKPSASRPLSERILHLCGVWREKASKYSANANESNGGFEKAEAILELVAEIEKEAGTHA